MVAGSCVSSYGSSCEAARNKNTLDADDLNKRKDDYIKFEQGGQELRDDNKFHRC